MSVAHDILKLGHDTRGSFFGESVTMRGISYPASVNRLPTPLRLPGEIDITPDEGANIQIDLAAPEPRNGEVLVDSYGRTHRINTHVWTSTCWSCACTTEPGNANG